MNRPTIKPPQVVKDLYLDLRDRRLLPVVALLAVALVAIPIALGGGSEQPLPASDAGVGSAAANDAESVAQLTPFVTSEVPGIREFDERLDQFKRRNPFQQQLTEPPKSAQRAIEQAAGQLEPPGDSGSDSGGADTASSTDTTASATPPPLPSSSTDSGSIETPDSGDSGDSGEGGSGGSGGSGGNGGSGGGNGGSGGDDDDEIVLFSWRINVKVGPLGEGKKLEGVKPLEFLPGNERPIAQFVRGDFDASEAVFVISRDARATDGQGECKNARRCQYLLLEEGEGHQFVYGPSDRTFRLKLISVELVKEKVDPSEMSAEEFYSRVSAYGDLIDSITG